MRRPPVAVVIPSLVLLLAGPGLVVAALASLAFTPAWVGATAVAGVVGVPAILTGWHLYRGHRSAWLAAMVLLPIIGVVVVLDSYAFGTGRLPGSRLTALGLAWVCLLLPATRAFVAGATASRVAGTSSGANP